MCVAITEAGNGQYGTMGRPAQETSIQNPEETINAESDIFYMICSDDREPLTRDSQGSQVVG